MSIPSKIVIIMMKQNRLLLLDNTLLAVIPQIPLRIGYFSLQFYLMLANCNSLKEWHALLLEIVYALLVTDANCITYAQKVVNGRY